MKPQGLDVSRRHPLCPYCHYDLIATIAEHKRVCPECGADFSLDELHFEQREGDWSMGTALRSAARALTTRALLGVLVWIVIAAACNLVARLSGMQGLIPLIAGAGGGYLIGRILVEGLAEHCGFESIVLPILAAITAIIVVVMGQSLLELILPFTSGWGRTILVGSGLMVCWTKIIATYALDAA